MRQRIAEMIKAVLFDYGGTLVTSVRPWGTVRKEALEAVFKYLRRTGSRISLREYFKLHEKVFQRYALLESREDRDLSDETKYAELIHELFPELSKRKANILASQATEAYWRIARRNYDLRTGVRMCLRTLASMGVRMALVSNHHDYDSIIKMLKRTRIRRYFREVIVSEKVGIRKPNPKIFKSALSALGVSGKQAVFVGDSLVEDIEGAKKAGLIAIYVRGGESSNNETLASNTLGKLMKEQKRSPPKPDFSVNSLSEIPKIIVLLPQSGSKLHK